MKGENIHFANSESYQKSKAEKALEKGKKATSDQYK